MDSNNNVLVLKLLLVLAVLSVFCNLMNASAPIASNTCGLFNVSACYPTPPLGAPTFSGLSIVTVKSMLLTPEWAIFYVTDTLSLFGSILLGGFSLPFGGISILIDSIIGLLTFAVVFLSLDRIIEFGKTIAEIVEGFLGVVGDILIALGASSVSLIGVAAFVSVAAGASVLVGWLL